MDPAMKQTKNNLTENRKRRQKGFSLIEALIAAVMMAIGLLALLAMFATALAATQYSQQDLIARQKARGRDQPRDSAKHLQLPFLRFAA